MDSKQFAKIAARALALYCLLCFVIDLSTLPQQLIFLFQRWPFHLSGAAQASALAATAERIRQSLILGLMMLFLRMSIYLTAAVLLYRFGPHVQRYFNDEPAAE